MDKGWMTTESPPSQPDRLWSSCRHLTNSYMEVSPDLPGVLRVIWNKRIWHDTWLYKKIQTNIWLHRKGFFLLRGVEIQLKWGLWRAQRYLIRTFLIGAYLLDGGPQWLRCCATNRKVAGSIPAGVIVIFHLHKILPIALWHWDRLSL